MRGIEMHVLVAGAGILGRELIRVLLGEGHEVTALALNEREFNGLAHSRLHCKVMNVTRPETLSGAAAGVDAVISCIGITRVNGRVTHRAVDYQGNLNLLMEAKAAGVKLFAIVSPEGVEAGRDKAPLLEARYMFEKVLMGSGINWLIVHSGGFFADLAEVAKMVRKSPMFVIGSGTNRFTPIAVADLASIIAEEIKTAASRKIHVGGPQTLSWNDILRMCFEHWQIKPRIYHVPEWVCGLILVLIRPLSPKYYAMGRLLLFMYTHDLPTPERGTIKLKDYFRSTLPV